jgi:hypothetical protein
VARPRKNPLPTDQSAEAVNDEFDEAEGVEGGEDSAPVAVKSQPGKTPKALRVLSLYAYWGEDGNLRRWSEGVEVTDPAEIADLIARGAPVEEA